ncbi:MAG: maleylacetate reductase [Rhizobiaceae bacterium]|nr:maleylacetate reductase [Rhizobiaceae bacterium]
MNVPAGQQTAGLRFVTPGDIYNATPPRIVFGAGAIDSIAEEVARLGAKRVMIVSTPGRQTMAEMVAKRLGAVVADTLPEAISQVPIEMARRGQQRARDVGVDCLVSVGGGASVGLGKAIALELGLPIIAIPTTYSGSEVTGFCGITIDGVKRMHTSLKMLATTIIYDPELTLSLPADVSAASALNALAHCVDVIYVPTADPMIVLAAIEGARVVAQSIREVLRQPNDVAVRSRMLYGAYLSGAALTGGFALQHGLAHTLGGSFNVPHGLSHAIILPHVAAYNARYAAAPMTKLANALGTTDVGGAIFDLLVDLGLPTALSQVGISPLDVPQIAQITVETDNGLNPGPVTIEAVTGITEAALRGERPATP